MIIDGGSATKMPKMPMMASIDNAICLMQDPALVRCSKGISSRVRTSQLKRRFVTDGRYLQFQEMYNNSSRTEA
jgi:hypothetical protein